MKVPFEQIEARLRNLIEGSALFLGKNDLRLLMAHHLVEAMQANWAAGESGLAVAPDSYSIAIHPTDLYSTQNRGDWAVFVLQALKDTALEYGLMFEAEPMIEVFPDASLPPGQVRVSAGFSSASDGSTAALPIHISGSASLAGEGAYLVLDGNAIYPIQKTVVNLGRRPENDVVINDPRVSRSHAQIRLIRGQHVLFDLNSTGGTYVNGAAVHQFTLKPGDVISLAGSPIIYGQELPAETDRERTGNTNTISPGAPPPPELLG